MLVLVDMPDLRIIQGGMTDPASQVTPVASAVEHAPPTPSPAEWDYKKNVEVERIKLEALKEQHAHWDKVHVHELMTAKDRRDHLGRMFAGICIAVGVFGLAGYLAHKDMTTWAIGVCQRGG